MIMPRNTPTTMAIRSPATVLQSVSQPYDKNNSLNRQNAGQRSDGEAIL